MTGQFAGKVALVTAAGAGIGAATAAAFASRGTRVMLADIYAAAGEAQAKALRADGGEVDFLRGDATTEEDVTRLVAHSVDRFGALHIAANVVGDAHAQASGAEFHAQSLESWEHTQAVTLRSVFLSMSTRSRT